MPFRSAKMNWRIFGFQRRVWCPKWTPAARSASSVGVFVVDCCCWSAMWCSNLGLVVDVGRRHRLSQLVSQHLLETRASCEIRPRFGTVDPPSPVATEDELLTLRELESLTRLRTTRLLSLDRACVARQEAEIAKLPTMRFVDHHQRTSDGETKRARLTRVPTT